ncbi:MAG: AAA family ATPase [Prosthecobacter sp.]|uniref:AAA family ATPase n=1 Tax=Prosthecobacter sp. TaxID=1965333 RepID=UPI003903A94A
MFIGRSEETARLRGAIEARAPKIALVYGRRRIGKTALIRQAIGREPALFIEGLENQTTQAQIASFLDQASRQLRRKLPQVTTWQTALMELDKALASRRMVIVLDEFQWLANYRQELVSTLKMVWETRLGRKPGRTLILCGSIASFMTTKVLNSSAFYGRIDVTVHLQGFHLAETARMLPKRGTQEILDAQCFTGGVPKYLELLSSGSSIAQGMNDEAFRAHGYFVEEYQRIFTSHFGWNDEFQRLIRALAAAPYGLTRRALAAAAGVDEGGMLTQRLYDLEAAGFISSQRPFDKGHETRLLRYHLSDPWISFYHAFMRTRLKQIREGTRRDLFNAIRQTGAFRSWMGRAFELVCMRHGDHLAQILGFGSIHYDSGPWFRAPRKGIAGVQIDLAYDRDDKVITLCEMKRQTAPIGCAIIQEVERKAEVLRAEFPGRTIQPVLVVDGPVSREVEASGYFFRILQASELMK